MPQIIYTDSIGSDGLLINTTNAGKYSVCPLETILDAIVAGNIQCGTGELQSVNWDNDNPEPPWEVGGPTPSHNQWKMY